MLNDVVLYLYDQWGFQSDSGTVEPFQLILENKCQSMGYELYYIDQVEYVNEQLAIHRNPLIYTPACEFFTNKAYPSEQPIFQQLLELPYLKNWVDVFEQKLHEATSRLSLKARKPRVVVVRVLYDHDMMLHDRIQWDATFYVDPFKDGELDVDATVIALKNIGKNVMSSVGVWMIKAMESIDRADDQVDSADAYHQEAYQRFGGNAVFARSSKYGVPINPNTVPMIPRYSEYGDDSDVFMLSVVHNKMMALNPKCVQENLFTIATMNFNEFVAGVEKIVLQSK